MERTIHSFGTSAKNKKSIQSRVTAIPTERKEPTHRWSINVTYRMFRVLCAMAFLATTLLLPMTMQGQEPVQITEDLNDKHLYLIQTNQFHSFYMVPKDGNANTNNIPGEYMLWYFLNAGTDDNRQYYYIVNNNTGKYICNSDYATKGRTITLADFDSADTVKFLFKLDVNTSHGAVDFYNIDIKPNGSQWIGLNKQGGSVAFTNGIRLTNNDNNHYINDYNSQWKFIPYDGTFVWPDPPFTISTDSDKHYYKIHNVQTPAYYVSTDATPDKVTYASTETNNMVWYFKEAGSDSWFKYYYIVNPAANDKYMYYSGTTTNGNEQTNAVCVKTHGSENEDRFQFVVVQAARGDGDNRVECYAIIPKLLTGQLWKSNSLGPKTSGEGNMGIISSRSASNKAQWQFDISDYPLQCAAPTITYSSATGKITLASTTPGCTIKYTTDETTPSSSNGTTYYDPFDVTTFITIKAIAIKSGYDDSDVTTKSFDQVATPSIQDNGSNAISITCTTEGATIHYTTNGDPPTTSSTVYTDPLTENVSGVTIKAIAVKDGMINSAVKEGSVTLRCAKPIISKVGNYVTISCSFPTSGVSIHYTKNGGTPNASSPQYSSSNPISVVIGDVIRAIAIATGYNDSEVAVKTIYEELPNEDGIYYIDNNDEFEIFTDMANEDAGATYHYELRADVNAASVIIMPFSGIFDGSSHTITGLSHPLFNTVNGGTVKNLVLDDVGISGSGNIGAICNEADGATKIYNCGVLSGSVSGGTNTGGLVGLIKSGSSVRVVNCYNFANVSGGDYAAGIVGKNEGTVSSNGTVGNVRIALCMMYGNVTGATNKSPVYGGIHEDNVSKFTEYNYWRYKSGLQYTALNDQLPVREDEYLSRFPFFRHILNSHRKMAAFFLFGASDSNDANSITSDEISEIGHWVLKKDVALYPIIEPWPTGTHTTPTSTNNNLPSTTDDYAGKLLTNMGANGYLTVSVKIGTYTNSVSLPITDMDTLNYDFTWGKVVLPFANEFSGWTSGYDTICTGWKITGISGGTAGTFEHYNVSDRKCTNKDLYETTGFIFAQGGNYIVPYGVTAIEITANFATAYYLCDKYYEIAYSGHASGDDGSGYVGRTGLAGSTPDKYHEKTVYNTLNAALAQMAASGSVHNQAVVLVGNYHWDGEAISGAALGKGYTIMSVDDDNNQEPDYALYSNNTQNRPSVPPTRYDFLAMIPLGMSSYLHGSIYYPNVPIWKPYGWFEMTETSLTRADQFEIDSKNFNTSGSDPRNYRCIINGGYFTQMVRSFQGACTNLSYYQIGGKAYVKEFYPGNHSTHNFANTLVPVNVTGGEIEQCFMTGYGIGKAYGKDIYFWCAGGRIHKFLGAYMEPPVETSSGTSANPGTVNLTAKIDHARIYKFFGGGTTSKARITGNINVTIDNSLVDFYCGGPEFGDMVTGANGKTITTTADHTTFREYYGAGFGGTAISYTNDKDDTKLFKDVSGNTIAYPSSYYSSCYLASATNVGRLDYKSGYGIGSCYKYEYIMHSRGHAVVSRFYTGYAMFSLAKSGSVTNTLTHCTVEGSFYGAGCQGTVDGTVTSTLTDCTIHHSAFGGGYKAESNNVEVYKGDGQASPLSIYYGESGVFSDFGPIPTPDIYTWMQGTSGQNNVAVEPEKKLYTGTDVTLTDLGNVTGAITLTLEGHTVVNENVFGGGNESKSLNNATVILKDTSEVQGNVFGGGNKAAVNQNTTVKIQGTTHILGNVYGGGNEGPVGGDSEVIIQDE